MRNRVFCSSWSPSQGSKYYYCEYFELEREPCPFEDGHGVSQCENCEYYAKQESRGRPNLSGVDWNNREEVLQRRRDYYASKSNSST